MITIPKAIRVERHGRSGGVTVDGEPFPYAIADTHISVSIHHDERPTVTLTLVADRVEVVDDINGEG